MSLNEAVIKSNIIPEEFIFMAEHCQLCFLSTVRDNIPDIHIMFFSYYKDENVIILSSEKNKKFEDIALNPHVSILLHSFEGKAMTQCSFEDKKPSSITIQSKAFFAPKEKEEEFRQILMKNHPKWGNAFIGENKVIIVVPVEKLLIVDVKAKITRWTSDI